jgi:hypothetical protein
MLLWVVRRQRAAVPSMGRHHLSSRANGITHLLPMCDIVQTRLAACSPRGVVDEAVAQPPDSIHDLALESVCRILQQGLQGLQSWATKRHTAIHTPGWLRGALPGPVSLLLLGA